MNKTDEIMKEISDWKEYEEKIRYWMNLKGAQKYKIAIDYTKNQGFEPTFQRVSRIYKTDKKLNYLLQRYLSFFEEYLKAGLTNHYDMPIYNDNIFAFNKSMWDSFPSTKANHLTHLYRIVKRGNITSWFEMVEHMSLSNVIHHIIQMEDKTLSSIYPLSDLNSQEKLRAINDLRNAVAHNRFLLTYDFYHDFKENEFKCNLYGHVVAFASLLPKSHSKGNVKHDGLMKEFDNLYTTN